jgi:Spx/MgsR family transcriptional regulator
MTTLYGIKNCDTIKKARSYLELKGIDYSFHDYRVDGLDRQQLQQWTTKLGWQALVNKRSNTWRQLPEVLKNSFNEQTAIETMLEQPTLIKRPLLELNSAYYLGFSIASYDALFVDAASQPS